MEFKLIFDLFHSVFGLPNYVICNIFSSIFFIVVYFLHIEIYLVDLIIMNAREKYIFIIYN